MDRGARFHCVPQRRSSRADGGRGNGMPRRAPPLASAARTCALFLQLCLFHARLGAGGSSQERIAKRDRLLGRDHPNLRLQTAGRAYKTSLPSASETNWKLPSSMACPSPILIPHLVAIRMLLTTWSLAAFVLVSEGAR